MNLTDDKPKRSLIEEISSKPLIEEVPDKQQTPMIQIVSDVKEPQTKVSIRNSKFII